MLQALYRRIRLRARIESIRDGGPKAHRAPARWVRRPTIKPGARLCIFVVLARGGRLLPHSIDHARAWHDAGYDVVITVVVDSLDQSIDTTPVDFADGLLLRVNRGYDFGAWAATIRLIGRTLAESSILAIANDSVVGPSSSFGAMLYRVAGSGADLVGLVESKERAPHFQSFVLFFKQNALRSRVFRRFWNGVRSGEREYVVNNYEVTMRSRFEAAGLRTEPLHAAGDLLWFNPTINGWRALLDAGFPYLKVQLLRDNPHHSPLKNWREAAARSGFDLLRLEHQLEELERIGGSPWAFRIADQE